MRGWHLFHYRVGQSPDTYFFGLRGKPKLMIFARSKFFAAQFRCYRGSIQSLLSLGPNYVKSLIDFNKSTTRVHSTNKMVEQSPLASLQTVIGFHSDNSSINTHCTPWWVISAIVVVSSTRFVGSLALYQDPLSNEALSISCWSFAPSPPRKILIDRKRKVVTMSTTQSPRSVFLCGLEKWGNDGSKQTLYVELFFVVTPSLEIQILLHTFYSWEAIAVCFTFRFRVTNCANGQCIPVYSEYFFRNKSLDFNMQRIIPNKRAASYVTMTLTRLSIKLSPKLSCHGLGPWSKFSSSALRWSQFGPCTQLLAFE